MIYDDFTHSIWKAARLRSYRRDGGWRCLWLAVRYRWSYAIVNGNRVYLIFFFRNFTCKWLMTEMIGFGFIRKWGKRRINNRSFTGWVIDTPLNIDRESPSVEKALITVNRSTRRLWRGLTEAGTSLPWTDRPPSSTLNCWRIAFLSLLTWDWFFDSIEECIMIFCDTTIYRSFYYPLKTHRKRTQSLGIGLM